MFKIYNRKKLLLRSTILFLAIINLTDSYASLPSVDELDNSIGYRFTNPSYIESIFRHPSRHPENRDCFERLEFWGDGVLRHVVSKKLKEEYRDGTPGQLSKKRDKLVSNKNNRKVINNLNILRFIAYQDSSGGLKKIKADTCEALLGAIEEDGGLEAARAFILRHWFPIQTTVTITDNLYRNTISFRGFTGTFEASTKKAFKRKAAKAIYEFLTREVVDLMEAPQKLHRYCLATPGRFVSYGLKKR